ncbi:hypothetical protein EGM85_05595 [Macrococcus caseolyticus]|nr:hypothetical protein [Macrococcus caseolyticus]RKO15260.1 hypothetical protein D6861_05595 [Macrococcus caseolyticus]
MIVEVKIWSIINKVLSISSANFNFKSRLAEKTPKKPGYSIAIWKKESIIHLSRILLFLCLSLCSIVYLTYPLRLN